MSASTPNIGLTLPVGTEKVSRAIINQNMTKIDTAFGNMTRATMRPVPFDVPVSAWSGSGSSWTATFLTDYITSTSHEILTFTSSIKAAKADDLDAAKKSGGGGLVFTSSVKPIDTISGTAYVWDADDGKVPIIIEGTVTPIENGGTNASNVTGAKNNLGITALENNVQTLSEQIGPFLKTSADVSGMVNLSSYTTVTNSFTCPCNGYIRVTDNNDAVYICGQTEDYATFLQGNGKAVSAYATKGTKFFVSGNSARFIPMY